MAKAAKQTTKHPTPRASMTVTPSDVAHIAQLANIPVTDEEKAKLADGFTTTMMVVDDLKKADTSGMEPTSQVTGLENVFREDEIDEARMFTQEMALKNTSRTHNGLFVVAAVLDQTIDP